MTHPNTPAPADRLTDDIVVPLPEPYTKAGSPHAPTFTPLFTAGQMHAFADAEISAHSAKAASVLVSEACARFAAMHPKPASDAVRVAAQELLADWQAGGSLWERFEAIRTALSTPAPVAVEGEVERDAARYRWLRESSTGVGDAVRWQMVRDNGDSFLDAAIDAALASTKKDGQRHG